MLEAYFSPSPLHYHSLVLMAPHQRAHTKQGTSALHARVSNLERTSCVRNGRFGKDRLALLVESVNKIMSFVLDGGKESSKVQDEDCGERQRKKYPFFPALLIKTLSSSAGRTVSPV